MGISRLKWSGIFLLMGLAGGVTSTLELRRAPHSAYQQGKAEGAGFVALICYVASAAFAIQHFRHRHDYDDEDHYE
jgi:hypothetical protein